MWYRNFLKLTVWPGTCISLKLLTPPWAPKNYALIKQHCLVIRGPKDVHLTSARPDLVKWVPNWDLGPAGFVTVPPLLHIKPFPSHFCLDMSPSSSASALKTLWIESMLRSQHGKRKKEGTFVYPWEVDILQNWQTAFSKRLFIVFQIQPGWCPQVCRHWKRNGNPLISTTSSIKQLPYLQEFLVLWAIF